MKSAAPRFLLLLVASAPVAMADVDFPTQIAPIFENAGLRCHNIEKAKGGLRLDTRAAFLKGGEHGPLINEKDWEKSELLRRVKLPRDHEDIMPQETEPLSGPHKNWLTDWVRSGAKWPDGLVLRMKKKEVPGLAEKDFIPTQAPKSLAEAAAWTDQILTRENEALKDVKLKQAAVIDDLAFLRRATVDLIGRIPTTDEIKQFEADRSANKREQLVDRLIRSEERRVGKECRSRR